MIWTALAVFALHAQEADRPGIWYLNGVDAVLSGPEGTVLALWRGVLQSPSKPGCGDLRNLPSTVVARMDLVKGGGWQTCLSMYSRSMTVDPESGDYLAVGVGRFDDEYSVARIGQSGEDIRYMSVPWAIPPDQRQGLPLIVALSGGRVLLAQLTTDSRVHFQRLNLKSEERLFEYVVSGVSALTGLVAMADGSAVVTGEWHDSEVQGLAAEGFLLRFGTGDRPDVLRLGAATEPRVFVTNEGTLRVAASFGDSATALAEVAADFNGPLRWATHPFSLKIRKVNGTTDGRWLVLAQGDQSVAPVLDGNGTWRPNSPADTELLTFSSDGSKLVDVKPVWMGAATDLALAAGEVPVVATPGQNLRLPENHESSWQPVMWGSFNATPPRQSFALAFPNVVSACPEEPTRPSLMWHSPEVPAGYIVVVRRDSPSGQIVAVGGTGSVPVPAADASYLVLLEPVSGELRGQVLATAAIRVERDSLRCSGVLQRRGELKLLRNPVISCYGAAGEAGGPVDLRGKVDVAGKAAIRVGNPEGPILAAGDAAEVLGTTGDWVRNGMEFFLSLDDAPFVPVGSDRAYVLAGEWCTPGRVPPQVVASSTRDCREPERFTLAFHAQGSEPITIYEVGSATPLARLAGPSGLLDVTAERKTTYQIQSLRFATQVVADPAQPCGQGRPQ